MIFFDNEKKSQNGIEMRVFILKKNLFECDTQNIIQKMAWSSLQNLNYSQNDNIITFSSEQSQKNKAADMVQFITKMGAALNFEKIIYFVKNKKDDFILTLWEDYKCINETIKDKNGNEKEIHRGIISDVIEVKNNITGEVFYSESDSKDDSLIEINGLLFPANCVISSGKTAIMQLESNGKLTKAIEFKKSDSSSGFIIPCKNSNIDEKTGFCPKNICVLQNDNSQINFSISSPQNIEQAKHMISIYLFSNNVSAINISYENKNCNCILTIHKQNQLFSIGIINELNETILYYNNKNKKDDYIEINGETYPAYMCSSDYSILQEIIVKFILKGNATNKYDWIAEKY